MTLAAFASAGPAEPSEADMQEARNASRALARLAGHDRVRVEAVADNEPPQTFILPAPAVRMLTDMLAHLAEGRMVAVIPNDAELTTQQAADALNVSRPYLVKLLERGEIRFHKTGTHRRVRFGDLQTYLAKSAQARRAALDDLAAEGQALDMGY